ncbi:DUF2163 domain-containing protein [Sphingomonas humi]|uniref:DUF2163 domain-containing protein n=1 Tax=Sphingomonas humi TaxID=335630 RepID=UPI0031E02011
MSRGHTELTTGAYHFVLQRPDGVGFAATSNDQPLAVGTMTFEPDVDLRPTTLVLSERLIGSKLQIEGSATGPAMPVADLFNGRWNGASLQLLSADWSQNSEGNFLCEGRLGSVRLDAGRMTMTIDVGPASSANQPCVQTSPECRALLGDNKCRIDMRSRRRRATVTAIDDRGISIDTIDIEPFVMGRLRWLSGANCGLEQRIIAADGAHLVLQTSEGSEIGVGDCVVLTEGCDGRRATCSERFANVVNFRGEPDLPGSQILLRFPGD